MKELKIYNGVKIFVHHDGTFYCDPIENRSEYKFALIKSEKMGSVEKAIDNYGEGADFKNRYVVIRPYVDKIEFINSISKMGNRIFFNDKTVSDKRHDLVYFYNDEILNDEIYTKNVLVLSEELENNSKIVKQYLERNLQIRKEIGEHMLLLKKYKAF